MNIEDKIIEIEKRADEVLEEAEKKSAAIDDSFDVKKGEISKQIEEKFQREKEDLEKEQGEKLKEEILRIERLQEKELMKIREIADRKSKELCRKIMEMIVKV